VTSGNRRISYLVDVWKFFEVFLIVSAILFDNCGVSCLDGIIVFNVWKRFVCERKVVDWIVVFLIP
jgi:hypothetical protein